MLISFAKTAYLLPQKKSYSKLKKSIPSTLNIKHQAGTKLV